MRQENVFRQTKLVQFRLSGHGGQLRRQAFDDIGTQVIFPEHQAAALDHQRGGQNAARGQLIAQALAQGLGEAGAVDLKGFALFRRRGPELAAFKVAPERGVHMPQGRGNVAQQHAVGIGHGRRGHLEPPLALFQHGQLVSGRRGRRQGRGIGRDETAGLGRALVLGIVGQRQLGGAHLRRTQLALDLRGRAAVVALAVLPDGLRHAALGPGPQRRGPQGAEQGQDHGQNRRNSRFSRRNPLHGKHMPSAPHLPSLLIEMP